MNKFHLSLYFTLFSILTTSLLSFAAEEPPAPVLDMSNEPVLVGTSYYVVPVIDGRGGGATLAPIAANNKTCPVNVIQEPLESSKGLPLTIVPVNVTKGVVRILTDNNIRFSSAPSCVKSTVWKISYEESTTNYFVTSGGVRGNPGRETVDNWFQIQEYDGDYKFVYCPKVCNLCKVVCKDVAILEQDGKRRLGLSNYLIPFKVMFMNINSGF